MLALSVSISTSSSPRLTSSPSAFSHLRIVPSSIESDRRGIATSAIAPERTAVAKRPSGEQVGDRLRRHRAGEEEPLADVAAEDHVPTLAFSRLAAYIAASERRIRSA